jgi:hypothetical protein
VIRTNQTNKQRVKGGRRDGNVSFSSFESVLERPINEVFTMVCHTLASNIQSSCNDW